MNVAVELGSALCEAWGLPADKIRSLTLKLDAVKGAALTVAYSPGLVLADEQIEAIVKRYEITEVDA